MTLGDGAVRRSRRVLLTTLLSSLAGCALPAARSLVRADTWGEPLYLVAAGWHTGIALPVSAVTGPLADMVPAFPGARVLLFGWGQRAYYMAPAPGLGDLLRAMLPGPSVVLVTPLFEVSPAGLPAGSRVFRLGVDRRGLARLCDYVWRSFALDATARPKRLAAGPCSGCAFYASDETYDLGHTCNTWTAEGLRVAGLPVTSEGVVTAGQVLAQIGQ